MSAATVASTAIAAAQWAVTQVNFLRDLPLQQRQFQNVLLSLCICVFFLYLYMFAKFSKNTLNAQTAQNGSSGGQSVDTGVYQQGSAVTYNQEGHEYSGPDGATFKAQADARLPALLSLGASLVGTYSGGAAPGRCSIHQVSKHIDPVICVAMYILTEPNFFVFACSRAAAISSEAVTLGSKILQQSLSHSQTALSTTAAANSATQVRYRGLLTFCGVILTISLLLYELCLPAG